MQAKELAFRWAYNPTLYDWMRTEDFLQKIRLGPNSVAWRGDEVQEWLDNLGGRDDNDLLIEQIRRVSNKFQKLGNTFRANCQP